MVRLYCFLRLNLKTSTFLSRSLPVMVPVILWSAVSVPASTSPASLKTANTFENSISEPISPASLGTRITSPGATRNCFPPVSIMACMEKASIGKPEHRNAAGLNDVNLDSITFGDGLPNPDGVLGRCMTRNRRGESSTMIGMRRLLTLIPALMTVTCGSRPTQPAKHEINAATAANLTRVFAELGQIFERETGIHLVTSFGATTQLAQQIEHGAPYDVFAAADTEHVDELARKGLILE